MAPDQPPPLPDPEPPPLPVEEVIELVPDPVPVVQPIRRLRRRPEPPQPGFWLAMAWCCGLLFSLYVPFVLAGGFAFVAMALVSGNPKQFFQDESQQLKKFLAHAQATNKANVDPPPMPDGVSYSLAVGMAAGHVGSLTMTLLLLRFGVGPDWKRKTALRRPPVIGFILALLILPGLMFTHAAIHAGLHEVVEAVQKAIQPNAAKGSGSIDGPLKSMLAPWPVWLGVLIIGVGPGVIEEFFCRGFLGRGLIARYGLVGGVLLTSLLFGMLHVDPLYAIGTMMMGIMLHVTYLTTRSIWVPVTLHFLNNTLSVLALLGVRTAQGLEAAPNDSPTMVYLLSFALTVVGMWALWSGRAELVSTDPEQRAWQPAYPGVELPPKYSGTVVRSQRPNMLAVGLTLALFVGLAYYLT